MDDISLSLYLSIYIYISIYVYIYIYTYRYTYNRIGGEARSLRAAQMIRGEGHDESLDMARPAAWSEMCVIIY